MVYFMNIKQRIKQFVFSFVPLYWLAKTAQKCFQRSEKSELIVENQGLARIHKDIVGTGNKLLIGTGSVLYDAKIRIHGLNNTIKFGEYVCVGPGCSFWIEGDNCVISIGDKTSFTMGVHFCVQENGMEIKVGDDCMFSNSIIVRTSDSHPIYDENNIRINPAKDVHIGNHVWVAPNTKVMKGVCIGDGAIIGSDTMVTKDIPENSCAVGHPAKVVKSNIKWTRDQLF